MEAMETKPLELPKEDYVPVIDGLPKKFSMIVFGPPKVGKTTFGSEFEKSLILELEPGGADHVRCRKLDISSLRDFRSLYKTLKEDTEYSTIVIDSLDKIASWIEDEICAEMGLTNIMDAKKGERHGSQWGEYKARVLGFLSGMSKLDKRVIFLAHTKRADIDNNGQAINPKTINLYGQCASQVLALVDNVGYMFAEEVEAGKVKHFLSFRPGAYVEAGARHPALSGKRIELPKGKAYAAFEDCFKPQPPAKPLELPKDEKKKGGKK